MRVVEMTQRKYWCGAIHLARPRAYFKRRVAGQKHFVRGEGLRLRLIGLCAIVPHHRTVRDPGFSLGVFAPVPQFGRKRVRVR